MTGKARFIALMLCIGFTIAASTFVRAGDEKKGADDKSAASAAASHDAFDALKSLQGTWVSIEPGPDGTHDELIFKPTGNGTVVTETMFPGSKHEMLNTYHMDGDRLLVTHYCAQGVQPRMKLTSAENGVYKFEFLDCTNLKSGEGHMGGLELTIDGERLVERWLYLKDGQVTSEMTFELTKKS
jgi:hypothetical protein